MKRWRVIRATVFFGAALLCGSALRAQTLGGCQMFPSNNIYNTPIDSLPVDARSDSWRASLPGQFMTLGFGPYNGKNYGFPYILVNNRTPVSAMSFSDLQESDPSPNYLYPYQPGITPLEPYDGGDAHALMLNTDTCILYELYKASSKSYRADNGALFNLNTNALIYDYSFSAASVNDAGEPMLPLMVRYDEVQAGVINHCLRMEASTVYARGTLWPATYTPTYIGITNPNVLWMGTRWRLKSTFNISRYSATARVILKALQKYGMIMSDIGSDWQLDGTLDTRWPATLIDEFSTVPSSELEAVDESSFMTNPGGRDSMSYDGTVAYTPPY
jgi:hypothetical protein